MTGRTLVNFKPVNLGLGPEIHIDSEGHVVSAPVEGAEIVDLHGAHLSPGWADLHVHVWHGGTDISIRADAAGLDQGVTTMADAGSAGEASFHGLREYVIEKQRETVKAFINIGSIGLVACNRVPELIDTRSIDVDRTLDVIEANRDVICGVKVRASGVIVGSWGITPAKIAKRVAEMCNLPLMVHVGEAPPLIDEVFEILTPGDVVTHCFNGKRGGSIRDTPRLMEMAQRLASEGILMDIGHGAASYNFDVSAKAIAAGMKPFSISTDLHNRNLAGPVFDLATTVSKVHATGLSFEDCVTAITDHPRGFLGVAAPAIGAQADFTAFTLDDSDEIAQDSQGGELRLTKVFTPRAAFKGVHHVAARRRPQ